MTSNEKERAAELLYFLARRLECVYQESNRLDYIQNAQELAIKLQQEVKADAQDG